MAGRDAPFTGDPLEGLPECRGALPALVDSAGNAHTVLSEQGLPSASSDQRSTQDETLKPKCLFRRNSVLLLGSDVVRGHVACASSCATCKITSSMASASVCKAGLRKPTQWQQLGLEPGKNDETCVHPPAQLEMLHAMKAGLSPEDWGQSSTPNPNKTVSSESIATGTLGALVARKMGAKYDKCTAGGSVSAPQSTVTSPFKWTQPSVGAPHGATSAPPGGTAASLCDTGAGCSSRCLAKCTSSPSSPEGSMEDKSGPRISRRRGSRQRRELPKLLSWTSEDDQLLALIGDCKVLELSAARAAARQSQRTNGYQ